jgi:HAD superfamily hydrolase (TIGR01458 family)
MNDSTTFDGGEVSGLLIDIDGVLTLSWSPIVGVADALATLRRSGLPLRFATNTTTRTRAEVARRLTDLGMSAEPDEILTAPAVTAAYLRSNHPGARCYLLNEGDITADLSGVDLVDDAPADVVVVGGAGPVFTYERVNRAFRLLLDGADFVAMHRNLLWRTIVGFELDSGAYVEALRLATGVEPVVLGKPAAGFFRSGVAELGVDADRVAMVGDDIDSDVLAAQALGLRGVLVRTGKFRRETLDSAPMRPDAVVDSFADVPALLGLR